MKIQISVIKMQGKYYAARSFPDNMKITEEWPSPVDIVIAFSLTEDIGPGGLPAFEERIRQEARRRGIAHIVNLD